MDIPADMNPTNNRAHSTHEEEDVESCCMSL